VHPKNIQLNHSSKTWKARQTTCQQQRQLAFETEKGIAPEFSSAANAPLNSGNEEDFSRDEMNLVEFPLALLSSRSNPNVKTLEFRETQRLRTGQLIEKEWIITGADKFGLPTSTDDDVVLGLMKLSFESDFTQRKVFFSRYQLLKALRWRPEGRNYSRLSKSLDRLSGVRIRTQNGFFNNMDKAYQTRNFGIIDAYEINNSRGVKGKKSPKSFFIWSEVLFDSFQASYIKKINLDLYFSLKSAVARRLYRYLDKHFYRVNRIERNLTNLAFEKLGLARSNSYVSAVKQQLKPALEELIRFGYLDSYEFSGRGENCRISLVKGGGAKSKHPLLVRAERDIGPIQKHGAKNTAVKNQSRLNQSREGSFTEQSASDSRFVKQEDLRQADLVEVQPAGKKIPGLYQTISDQARATGTGFSRRQDPQSKFIRSLVDSLASRGLGTAQALRLLENRQISELDQVKRLIAYFDFLVSNRDPKVSINQVGFLYRAVERIEDFKIPSDFDERSANSRAARPERRLIGAIRKERKYQLAEPSRVHSQSGPSEVDSRDAYRRFMKTETERLKGSLSASQMRTTREKAQTKVDCLGAVLDRQSVERCYSEYLLEELVKLLGLPSYDEWRE